MKSRCDGRVDCKDKSDEKDCGRAVIDSTYNKAMTPPPLEDSDKVSVELSVVLQAILNLDEIGGIMYIKYVLLAKWTDPGLTFHKGWLGIAKLKPLVERYSCQTMRRLDTSNSLSVGPSCM